MAQINYEELKKQMGNNGAGPGCGDGVNMHALDSEKLPTANIIIAGVTGAGKSTLINAVFGDEIAKTGVGRPVTPDIKAYGKSEDRIHIWDTMGLELDSDKAKKSIEDIKKTIASKASSKDPFDQIHAIWYCILAGSNRYQGHELMFIKSLHSLGIPFIIVITQCMRGEADIQFEKVVNDINKSEGLNNIDIIRVLAKDYETAIGNIPAHGLDKLVNVTLEKLPGFIRSGFAAAQKVDMVMKRSECEAIIYEYILAAKNGFWDRVPIINLFTTGSKIQNMFIKIGEMYNMTLVREHIDRIISANRIDGDWYWDVFNPIGSGNKGKVSRLLAEMQSKDGLDVKISDFAHSERSARCIAFYGYTFMMAVEEVWHKATEEKIDDIDKKVNMLIRSIGASMAAARGNRRGN